MPRLYLTIKAIAPVMWLLLCLAPNLNKVYCQESKENRQTKYIIWLPIRDYSGLCHSVFGARQDWSQIKQAEKLVHDLQILGKEKFPQRIMSLADIAVLLIATTDYQKKVLQAKEHYFIAKKYYESMKLKESTAEFKKSVQLMSEIYYDIIEPVSFSQILLDFGVTLVEAGDVARAHAVFRRMLHINPQISTRKGYYPHITEETITAACQDLINSPEKEFPLFTWERTIAFAQAVKAAYLIYPFVTKKQQELYLTLVVMDVRHKRIAARWQYKIPPTKQTFEVAMSRFDNWLESVDLSGTTNTTRLLHRYSLFADYTWGTFFKYPTRSAIRLGGFSVGGEYKYFPTFAIVGKVQFLVLLRDELRDLSGNVTSVRLNMGPVFSIEWRKIRIFLSPSFEVWYIGKFSTTTNPACKFFVPGSPGYIANCHEEDITDYPSELLFGLGVSFGGEVKVYQRLFVRLSTSLSGYLLPIERLVDLNAPIILEGGTGVTF